MLYVIYCEDRDDGAAEIRAEHRERHLAYLDAHQDRLVLGGALLGEDGMARLGSMLVLNVPSLQAAEDFSVNEPFRRAGLYKSVRIVRMRRAQWNPSRAPATPDGN